MPRLARFVVPDVALHIVQRGHDKRDCFREESDYLVYLTNLRELVAKTGCALHSYCLMTNHVHLLLTPPTLTACAFLMRNLGQRYVQYFNRRYRRSGTLWEGRFRSCLVDSAHYVMGCYRYIERNPVKAGMVPSPPDYRWSSYAGNAGQVSNQLITPHVEYLALAQEPNARLAAYQALLGVDDEPEFLAAIRDATNGGFALVGESVKSRLPAERQPRLARRRPGPAPEAVKEKDDITAELGLRPRRS
jgi:putative transposase